VPNLRRWVFLSGFGGGLAALCGALSFFWTAALYRRFLSLEKQPNQSGGKAPQSKKKAKPLCGEGEMKSIPTS
jgi:hypothetical protein